MAGKTVEKYMNNRTGCNMHYWIRWVNYTKITERVEWNCAWSLTVMPERMMTKKMEILSTTIIIIFIIIVKYLENWRRILIKCNVKTKLLQEEGLWVFIWIKEMLFTLLHHACLRVTQLLYQLMNLYKFE